MLMPMFAPAQAIANADSLLLHCDGSDASTTFTDDSQHGHTVTAYGDAQVDTAQSKFGGASLLLDGSGDYLQIPHSTEFTFGTGDFTIDLWVRPSTVSGAGGVFSKLASYGPFLIYRNGSAYQFYSSASGSSWNITAGSSLGTAVLNTWSHLAVTRSGNTFRLFQDGVQTLTFSTSASLYNGSNPVYVGRDSSTYFAGHVDEIRLTKGLARWTAGFTPPTSPGT